MTSSIITPTQDRSYHDTGATYLLPNDSVEQDRLDAQATAIVEMIGGSPLLAPVQIIKENLMKAVDIGCGTGVATVQIANAFPSATVYGFDISPPPESIRATAPSNIVWVLGNVLALDHRKSPKVDAFGPESLGYVFGRMLFLGINDWSRYFSVVASSLAPDGYVEHQDLDWKFYRAGTDECLSDTWGWHRKIVSKFQELGLSTQAGSDAAKIMEKEGLEIISVQSFEFSFSPYTKTLQSRAIGRYVRAKLLPQYPEFFRNLLEPAGMEHDELARVTEECLHNIESGEDMYQKYTVTIARKREF